MALPQSDIDYLEQRALQFSVTEEASMTCVLFPNFVLPPGLSRPVADLLIRLSAGFPDVPPDMWWFDMPGVHRLDSRPIPNTESVEAYLGRSWQRWSRHFGSGQWQPGTDTIESFLALVRRDLERWAEVEAVH